MIILSHRGWWLTKQQKNTEAAFRQSFENGFGTETDVRDSNGKLVISHDMPCGETLALDRFLEIYNQYDRTLPLALNIKADGLQRGISSAIEKHNITNYFVFDAAVPDAIQYARSGIPTFTRYSEYEPAPSFINIAAGVWLDCFIEPIISDAAIVKYAASKQSVCLVSPELHGYPHEPAWAAYKKLCDLNRLDQIMLCTDFPDEAREFFNA